MERQTPFDIMLKEQEDILDAMTELAELPGDDGDFYTEADVQEQAEVVAEIKVVHERVQARLGRRAANDSESTVEPAEAA